MKRRSYFISMLMLVCMLVSACGGAASEGNVQSGETASEGSIQGDDASGEAGAAEAGAAEAGAAGAAGAGEKLVFGVTLQSRTDDWSVDIERAMLKVADELGVELKIADADTDSAKMVQLAEDFVSMGVDAIISNAPNQSTGESILSVCQDADIPLFLFDSSMEDFSGITAYTTCDAYHDGELIAEWTENYIKENLADKETINVCLIDFFPSEICKQRTDGFIEKLQKDMDNINMVSRQDGKAARAESMSVMENILTANNNDVDIAVSIAGWDASAGVKAAIQTANADTKLIAVAWGEDCCLELENKDPITQAVLLGLPTDMARTVNAAYDYFQGTLEKPQIEYSYVMADHNTIADINWREIKGID